MDNTKLKEVELKEHHKYRTMYIYSILMILAGVLMNPFQETIEGILRIALSPSMLITDYLALGGIGASLVNSGILMVLAIAVGQRSNAMMNGPLIAAVFTIGGFALFGKNIYNVISIVFGVYLHSRIQKEHFAKYIIIAFFGTALAPVVSQVSFGMDLGPFLGVVLGTVAGISIGLILPPLASSFINFHQGFNLYNIGFTAGVLGMVFMSLFRITGYNHQLVSNIYMETDLPLTLFLILYFVSMVAFGLISSNGSLRDYSKLMKYHGRLVTDFVALKGFSLTMINMGILGLICTVFVLLFKAPMNGPVIGGIFTVVGFGSFGKHPKNVLPIMAGVVIGSLLTGVSLATTGAMLTALFATTLAPVAGYYGSAAGILAGFLHMSLVTNLGYLHGGMNLYNNGFSGGFIAAVLVPVFQAYKKETE